MKAYVSENVVTLKWDDDSGEANFSGYELSRKIMGSNDWELWNGSGWGGSASLLTLNYFSEFSLPEGGYQYRVRTYYTTPLYSEYSYTDWAIIGTNKIGWSFGTYSVPDGQFGDVLTPDDMRHTYMWGVDFKASNGETFTDEQIRFTVESAVREMERALNYTIVKRVLKCQPDESLEQGTDYDQEEDPYRFRPDFWTGTGFIPLRFRPVLSVERLDMYSAVDTKILDLLQWIRLDKRKGHIGLYPRAGKDNLISSSAYGMTMIGWGFQGKPYSHGFKIDYTAGLKNASFVEKDMREIIGKVAVLKLLNIIGDGLIAGFSSSSLSLDGVSESFSSTQSATSAYFGARIKVYADDVAKYIKDFRRKNGQFTMGML